MSKNSRPWMSLELRPGCAPSIERGPIAGDERPIYGYELRWDTLDISVLLTEAELQEIVSRAIVAQAEAQAEVVR